MIDPAWIYGLLGGLMIGGAAALYLLVNGRIMGASGILGGAVDGTGRSSLAERLAFIGGLVGAPALLCLFLLPKTYLTDNLVIVTLAGLAVGIGTRMANGCTSGHGVCGISRLSLRGIAATLTFLLFGGLTMLIARHLLGVI